MSRPPHILVAGSANLDFVVRAPHIPAPGETVLGQAFQTTPGGKGANQAVACARAGGAATQMLLALGDDGHAAVLEASLRDAGVQLHTVRGTGLPTGAAFICVADDASNAITVAPGANGALRPQHLPPLAGISHLLLQLETPLATVTAYAQAARAAGVQVVLNAAPACALPPALLAVVDVLVVNENELMTVAAGLAEPGPGLGQGVEPLGTGPRDPSLNLPPDPHHSPALLAALQRLPVPTVVATLGERGCLARQGGQLLHTPAFAVAAVDTTAAGDTFCGALVAALAQGHALPAALRRASAAAALACTRPGAQASIPQRAEVDTLLARHP